MKTTIKSIAIVGMMALTIASCKKDDGDAEMSINFKTGTGYTSADAGIDGGTAVKIGIEAETDKKKDPLIKFNISESVNGGTNASVYSEDLNDLTTYDYDYNFTLDTTTGDAHKYTFTVTNRDGITKQTALTITIQ